MTGPAHDPTPLTDDALCVVLQQRWGLSNLRMTAIRGGMNSAVWHIRSDAVTAAAKMVPARQAASLRAGAIAAGIVTRAGIPAGAAIPTVDGALVHRVGTAATTLSEWVDGSPLDGTGNDARVIGRILGRAHAILTRSPVPGAPGDDWVDADASHLDVEPWIRPVVREVLADRDRRRSGLTTVPFLHGDPSPEAFLHTPDGAVGLIDWSSGCTGPALYDVASALMYLDPGARTSLIDGYREHGPVTRTEIDEHLDAVLRFRWTVQADYFARRIAEDDVTGLDDRSENTRGLHDARNALLGNDSDRRTR